MSVGGERLFAMSEEAIAGALEDARNRLGRAEKDREDIERSVATAREEIRLLEQLLALRRGGVCKSGNADRTVDVVPPSSSGAGGEAKHQAVTAVIAELETAGRPVHISELMRLLRENQVKIPGAGTQANLIAHLRRHDLIVRPSRGMYGLAAWGLQSMVSGRRKRRKKKRMRSTSSEHA